MLAKWLAQEQIHFSTTAPRDFKGNCRAERGVGLLKRDARVLLRSKLADGLSLDLWPYAVAHASETRWRSQFGGKALPGFGCRVTVWTATVDRTSDFDQWGVEGKYLCPVNGVVGGACWVLVGNSVTMTTTVSPILHDTDMTTTTTIRDTSLDDVAP